MTIHWGECRSAPVIADQSAVLIRHWPQVVKRITCFTAILDKCDPRDCAVHLLVVEGGQTIVANCLQLMPVWAAHMSWKGPCCNQTSPPLTPHSVWWTQQHIKVETIYKTSAEEEVPSYYHLLQMSRWHGIGHTCTFILNVNASLFVSMWVFFLELRGFSCCGRKPGPKSCL